MTPQELQRAVLELLAMFTAVPPITDVVERAIALQHANITLPANQAVKLAREQLLKEKS